MTRDPRMTALSASFDVRSRNGSRPAPRLKQETQLLGSFGMSAWFLTSLVVAIVYISLPATIGGAVGASVALQDRRRGLLIGASVGIAAGLVGLVLLNMG
ncbi:hypothetical protein [Marinivivus vitaminiproducens]|uniref:hypothetical protein n=1 Tax=Marinivivus vitaminiproducens TaxID=3035935 RepID=UPI0027A55A99|nr:hypothetical protein P4R82_02670 [Geminicoccaceae bacterium SCSIO 64248]